jgi:hypothetical protein
MVRGDIGDRAHKQEEPEQIYYVTDHDVGYSAVLVRLSRIEEGVLRDLLGMAYKFVISKGKRETSSRASSRRGKKRVRGRRRGKLSLEI